MPATSKPTFKVLSHNKDYPPHAKIPAAEVLEFTTDDLARALFTTGRAPGDQAKHGHASFYEALHRCAVIPAYVRRNRAGALVRSRLATELDRSEKGAFSYALGQAMTTIFSRQVLGVTHLLHVDRYWAQEGVGFAKMGDKTRPDLFGPSANGWVVAEAKGRTSTADKALVKKLREQKVSVKTIHGKKPWVATGCVACFPTPTSPAMRVLTWDPDELADNAIDIEGNIDGFLRAYYAPLMSALALGDDVDVEDPDFVTTRVSGLNMTLGLRSDLFRALREQAINDRDPAAGFDATRLSRLALGSLYDLYSSPTAATTLIQIEDSSPQPRQPDPDVVSPRALEPPMQQPTLDDSNLGTVFADGTVFGTEWDDAIGLDDREVRLRLG